MKTTSGSAIWQPLAFALVLIVGMFLGYKLSKQSGTSSVTNTRLDDMIRLISDHYVDSLDEAKLRRSGIEGILKNLDPHTVYIPSEELQRVNEELEGTFYGIGVEFYIVHDTASISSVIVGGPSEHKQIVPGDKIIRIDDSIVAGKQLSDEDIIRRIRGKQNSQIKLQLQHPDGQIAVVTIQRNQVPLRSVPVSFKLNEETGYIKIDMFSETTYDEFKQALDELVKQNIRKLILDVRGNPGGYMDAVVKVADELISGKHTIVSTRGKKMRDSLQTGEQGAFEQGDLCILIDENSASASEILSGSIQDLDRGTLIGRRTYGKGLVQEQFELPDHSALRITTARYYLPSGRCIQRSYADGKDKYKHDLIDRYTNGTLNSGDSAHVNAKQFKTLKGRIVYGDEGVSPDIFIPLDTIYHSQLDSFYHFHIAEEFAHQYVYFHKAVFNAYKSPDDFSKNFQLDESIKTQLNLFLKQHKIDPVILNQSLLKDEIEIAIRSQFARILFGNKGLYKELYKQDAFIKKALIKMQS